MLRQMNLHLMGRGHAKSARDAVSMYSSVPGNLTPNKTKVVRVALTGGPCAGKPSAHSLSTYYPKPLSLSLALGPALALTLTLGPALALNPTLTLTRQVLRAGAPGGARDP